MIAILQQVFDLLLLTGLFGVAMAVRNLIRVAELLNKRVTYLEAREEMRSAIGK